MINHEYLACHAHPKLPIFRSNQKEFYTLEHYFTPLTGSILETFTYRFRLLYLCRILVMPLVYGVSG